MQNARGPDTVSFWSIWRDHRDELAPFGRCCALARQGLVPGTVSVAAGTHRVLADRVDEALSAMRKEGFQAFKTEV